MHLAHARIHEQEKIRSRYTGRKNRIIRKVPNGIKINILISIRIDW